MQAGPCYLCEVCCSQGHLEPCPGIPVAPLVPSLAPGCSGNPRIPEFRSGGTFQRRSWAVALRMGSDFMQRFRVSTLVFKNSGSARAGREFRERVALPGQVLRWVFGHLPR